MSQTQRHIRFALSCAGETVPRKHFGDCPEFRIYELTEDGESRLIETQTNTSPEEERHADPKKLKSVTSLLSECEVLVSGLQSPNFLRIRDTKPIQPVVTTEKTVEATLRAVNKAFDEISRLVNARRRGEHPPVILKISNE